jgi:acyl-CoA thioester hydrolase
MSSLFKHSAPIQIRFKDIDALGHVNNANFLSYLESARIAYFKESIKENINWSKKGIILANVNINYKIPVLLNDELLVKTRCSRIGTKSFDLSYSIVKIENGKEIEVADATTIMVCYDYETGQSIEMLPVWKAQLKKFEEMN